MVTSKVNGCAEMSLRSCRAYLFLEGTGKPFNCVQVSTEEGPLVVEREEWLQGSEITLCLGINKLHMALNSMTTGMACGNMSGSDIQNTFLL